MIYADWAPTAFDTKGLLLDERQNWHVAPVILTRDSGPLQASNFRTVLADLGGECEHVEVHRFGHWGPGWIEIVLCHPSLAATVEEWERKLADYPIADESDFSTLEWERALEYWAEIPINERVRFCGEHGITPFAARRDELPDDCGELIAVLAE